MTQGLMLVAGMMVGAIVPVAILSMTVFKGLRIEIKEHDDIKRRLHEAERRLDQVEAEISGMVAHKIRTAYSQQVIPYKSPDGFRADKWRKVEVVG